MMNAFLGRGTPGVPWGGRGRGTRRVATDCERRGSICEGADNEGGENEGPGFDGVSSSN